VSPRSGPESLAAPNRRPLSRQDQATRKILGARSAALEPVEAVEDEVERERELGVVIAWSKGARCQGWQ
jgi:hypothetical protein